MAKQVKKIYRFLLWFFSTVVASGSLTGCGVLYGVPAYGIQPYEYIHGKVTQKGGGPIRNIRVAIPETGKETTTSLDGDYVLNLSSTLPDITIMADDIDGTENGGDFASKSLPLTIASYGDYEVNVELELKN